VQIFSCLWDCLKYQGGSEAIPVEPNTKHKQHEDQTHTMDKADAQRPIL